MGDCLLFECLKNNVQCLNEKTQYFELTSWEENNMEKREKTTLKAITISEIIITYRPSFVRNRIFNINTHKL